MFFIIFLISLDTVKVDLNKALLIAFKNNPDMQIQYKQNTERKIDFLNSVFSYLPSLSAEGSYTNTETRVPTFLPGVPSPIYTFSNRGYTFTFSINQKIFSPSGLTNILNNYYLKERSKFDLINYEMKFVYDVENVYFNVLKTKKVLDVMKKSLERAEENFKLAEERYKEGLISRFDYMNIKVQKENALLNYKRAEKNYIDALYDFKLILGVKGDTIFIPQDLRDEIQEFKEPEKKTFYQYKAEKISGKLSRLNFFYNIFSFLPEVYFSYYYSYSDSMFRDLFKEPERTQGLYLTLSLRFWDYPFNVWKGKNVLDIEKENIKKVFLISKINLEKARKGIEVQKSALEAASEKLKSAELGYKIAKESFEVGKISSLELMQAEENYINSQVDYINSLYDYKLSISYYLYLSGNLKFKRR